MTQGWTLHAATEADLPEILAMEAAGFDPRHQESARVYRQRIACFPEGALIARVAGTAAGCFFAEIWPALPGPQGQYGQQGPLRAEDFALGHDIAERHDPAGTVLYVSSMTVAPAFRRGGWGRRLFADGVARVRAGHPAVTDVLLLVNETWAPARRIYGAQGFVEIARLPGFFEAADGRGQDGIVMRGGPPMPDDGSPSC